MTNRVTVPEKVVYFELPKGLKRRRRKAATVPPAVIEIRIDVNRNDTEQQPAEAASAVNPVAQAIEQAAVNEVDPSGRLEGLMGQLGGAVRDRIDGIIGATGDLVEHRVEELISTANGKIDELIEETVNAAMDTAIRRVVGQRISQELGVTIDLTQLEDQPEPAQTEPGASAEGQVTPSP